MAILCEGRQKETKTYCFLWVQADWMRGSEKKGKKESQEGPAQTMQLIVFYEDSLHPL